MSETFKEISNLLRHALERAALAHEKTAATYRRTQATIPESPVNAPLEVAERLLNAHGFCVLHRDELHSLIGITSAAEGESSVEQEQIDSLLAVLEAKAVKVRA